MAAHSYDEFLKILTRLHLLLHQPPLGVCAAVHVLLPLVVIQGNVLWWPELEKSDKYYDFTFLLFKWQWPEVEKRDNCFHSSQLHFHDEPSWKSATNFFLLTFTFIVTGAEKATIVLSSHFLFHNDRNWKKQQMFCLNTFTFMRTRVCLPTNYKHWLG